MNHRNGFTLPELLISILLLLILSSLAVPSFSHYLQHKKQQTYLHTLAETLELAHLYALQHQTMVKVCPSSNHQNCDGDWNHGGIAIADQHIIATFPAAPASQALTVLLYPNNPWVQFLPQGLATHSSGSFQLNDPSTRQTTTLILSNTGRLRLENN